MNTEDQKRSAGDVSGISGTPDAVEAAHVTKADPAFDVNATRARGVEWVRPTDLLARSGGAVAGRGIDFQREMASQVRGATTAGMRHVGQRARQLPPLSAFGNRGAQRGTERGAVGMR